MWVHVHQWVSGFVLSRADCLIQLDVKSPDTQKRLIPHKLVHSLTSPRHGESICFIVKTQFTSSFCPFKSIFNQVTPSLKQNMQGSPDQQGRSICRWTFRWAIQEAPGTEGQKGWETESPTYTQIKIPKPTIYSEWWQLPWIHLADPAKALISVGEISFWVFKPFSRQIYMMNSRHHKDCEHISVRVLGNKGENCTWITSTSLSYINTTIIWEQS